MGEKRRNTESADCFFDALIAAHNLRALAFAGYGGDAIKSWGMSPPAFIAVCERLMTVHFSAHSDLRATQL